MKKVYFAGSIRGGRELADIYAQIITYLKTNFIVLTEHIGDISLGTNGEKEKTDEYIYTRDCEWIKEADFIVAEVTNPSLGVGYEIGYAEGLHKPILCLYKNSDKKVSAMISGNKKISTYSYDSLEDVFSIINNYVNNNFK